MPDLQSSDLCYIR